MNSETAADLMSAPVHAVGPTTPVAEVHALLIRTRHGAVPVADGERLLGLALAGDVERADRHGLGERPVSDIMHDDPPTVTPDASVQAVIAGLAPPGPGRVLVVEKGRLVGHISRSDLLEALAAAPGAPGGGSLARGGRRVVDVSAILASLWNPKSLERLREIGRAAGQRALYLVGGAVRDLLLNRASYDLDLMIVGDGIALARELAATLGGKVTVHEPFGTATLELPGDLRIDVATARAERYDRPGALPDVRPAALAADLERRDFTINALALRIDAEAWGQLFDPLDGYRDLESRQLRILHALSFVEDPARIVRAVRFERQLGFKLAPSSERAARYALSTGKIDQLGGERLKLELRKLLAWPGVDESVARLTDLGGLRLLSDQLAGTRPQLAALGRLEALIARMESEGRSPEEDGQDCGVPDDGAVRVADLEGLRFRAALAIVLLPLEDAKRVQALSSLRIAGHDEQIVRRTMREGPELVERIPALEQVAPGAVFEALRAVPLEVLAVAVALSERERAPDLLIAHLAARRIRLCGLDGHWLQAHGVKPGPVLGRILADTLEAVLDRKIAGPEAERQFALDRARELSAIAP